MIAGLLLFVRIGWADPGAVYVATDGDDARPAGPCATLERAVEIARQRPSGQPRRIVLRGGTFGLSRTLHLTGADSGLSIEGAPNERPVLLGGRTIDGFLPWKGAILQTSLAAQGLGGVAVRQLFFAGRRQHLVCFFNFDVNNFYGGGWSYVDGRPVSMYPQLPGDSKNRLHYKPQDVHNWSRAVLSAASCPSAVISRPEQPP